MIPQETIHKILDATDIIDVIGSFITLTKKGVDYKACCPFHSEKTSSLSVSTSKNIWKCFGCGIGGDALKFVMEYEKMSYPKALKWLAKRYKIEIADVFTTPEEQAKSEAERKRKESLTNALRAVETFYVEQLKNNAEALKYAQSRMSDTVIDSFNIGFSPSGNQLLDFCAEKGIKKEFLIEIGSLKEGKRGLYDPFYNRLVFPICDRFGKPVGFTGRILPACENEQTAKYRNSDDSEIYHKGKTLYGYHLANKEIQKTKIAYLVEGNTDCTRMHEIGRKNTVAQMGTAITNDQIFMLQKSGAEIIRLCYDNDTAGIKATMINGETLIKAGLSVEVINLGDFEKDGKIDVDTLFKSVNIDEHEPANTDDYMAWRFSRDYNAAKTPAIKSGVLKNIATILSAIDDDTANFYIKDLGKEFAIKKELQDAYTKIKKNAKSIEKQQLNEVEKKEINATEAEEIMIQRYGFMERNGKYWFNRTESYGSNFILKPLFHVESVNKPKRIFSIINEYGISHEIEFDQKDLISLDAFKLKVEGLGNFLWKTDNISLMQLKSYLYDNTETCKEIEQLGWQTEGFWAWCNGIFYNNTFIPTDEMGVVKLPNEMGNYYLPALSKFYKRDKDIFESERRFIHRKEGVTSLYELTKRMTEVFGDNAIVLILFYINTLFRDVIVKKTNNFPILNLFGLKGTGKSELYHTMMQAFGNMPMAPNINSSSKASLGDHVAKYANALCPIDEYKNSLEFEKIEFLKGLYNSTGRTRMNMEKDKKKETTKADVGIVLAGQEMPTADIALFSRLLYTVFTKTEHTPVEVKKYEELKEIATNGFTNITHEILSLREHFKQNYDAAWETASELLSKELKNPQEIEDRIFKNWLMILTGYLAISEHISVFFTQKKIVNLFTKCIETQNAQTQSGNEISIFWTLVEYLYKENLIENDIDFRIKSYLTLKTDKFTEPIELEYPKNILLIDTSRIFPLYRKHAKQIIEQPLPMESLKFYVKNCNEYLGTVHAVRFKIKNPDTGRTEDYKNTDDPFSSTTQKKYKQRIARSMAFDYDALQKNGINLHIVSTSENDFNDEDSIIQEHIF